MFAGSFVRARLVRRMVSALAALLAFAGGVLVLVGSFGTGGATGIFSILVGLAALLGSWWIYRGGKALLFPRSRLTFAGLVTTAAGVVLFILGHGFDAMLVIAGGVISWVATIL